MPLIQVPYGNTVQSAYISDDITVESVGIAASGPSVDLSQALFDAMEHPIGTSALEQLASSTDTVSIVVNDHTRPGPNQLILQEVVRRLQLAGVPDANIVIVFATGSHRQTTTPEMRQIIGDEFFERFRLVVHDCREQSSLVLIGHTGAGMPVWINRAVAESSFCILTGLIASHHSAGYSGGRKSILPGVAGLESLRIHHSFPIRPYEPVMGWMDGNPFHEAALEAAKMAPVRFIVNAVQNPQKQFVSFVAGDLELAHARGAARCRKICEVPINGPADIIIASPGGHPRDRDLYQAQKALSVAELLGTADCTFILVARCPDGIGNQVFEDWMTSAKTPKEVLDRFIRTGFDAGNNKAFNYARALTKGRVVVVSDCLDPTLLHSMMLDSASNLQTALDAAIAQKRPNKILTLPQAVNIVPLLRQ